MPAWARSSRAWSAGCSYGAEPYSLAILLQELGPARRSEVIAAAGAAIALAYLTRPEGLFLLAPALLALWVRATERGWRRPRRWARRP